MTKEQQILFLNVCAYSSLVPAIASVIVGSLKRNRLIVAYFLYVVVAFVWQSVSARLGANLYLSFIFPALQAYFLISYFNPYHKKYTWASVAIVVASTIGEALNSVNVYNQVAATLSDLMISVFAILSAVHIGQKAQVQAKQVGKFWVSAGATIFFLFSTIVDVARQGMLEIDLSTLRGVLLLKSAVFFLFVSLSTIGMFKSDI